MGTTMEIALAIISILSFLIAIISLVRSRIIRIREEANVNVLHERLKNLYHSLGGILYASNAIVQIPKHRDVGAIELQDLARVARGQVMMVMESIKSESLTLDEWRFGRPLKSAPLEENVILDINENNGPPEEMPKD